MYVCAELTGQCDRLTNFFQRIRREIRAGVGISAFAL